VLRRAGVDDGLPFVLGPDGSYNLELNRFVRELDGWGVCGLVAATSEGDRATRALQGDGRGRSVAHVVDRSNTHPAEIGALSLVRAAVDPAARGGEYYCPDGRMEFKGHPVRRESSTESHDTKLQRRLWLESRQLTGVRYDLVEYS
jgi:hypothetical protein